MEQNDIYRLEVPFENIYTSVFLVIADDKKILLLGHTDDSIGVLDERSHTLISGDGLQGAGVDKYNCLLYNKNAYIETIEKIKDDDRIENILFSHAYEPWNKAFIRGREEVLKCLSDCIKCIGG